MSDNLENVLIQQGKTPYQGLEFSLEELQEAGVEPYLPGDELKQAVNLALLLEKRPLLLKGEPGSGKTRLAEAVAYELKRNFYPWYIKSTSQAKDGLYFYDAVKRLQDAQMAGGEGSFRTAAIERLEDVNHTAYVKMRELGKAYQDENPTVILIDEIDKADIDFPNDLLRELDRGEFLIEEREIDREIRAKHPPLVIITSNDEKDLPEAFLRRCIFFQIKFPDGESLKKIVQAHFPESSQGLLS